MTLPKKAKKFPSSPGVYLMKDKAGSVLYVGKAADLKKRVTAYFGKESKERYQIEFLMKRVADMECVVTGSEKEALLLENTLIKKYRPKYNIALKDDKSYVSIRLSTEHRFPRIYVTRQIKKEGSIYFGPYSSAHACRETTDFIERHFRLRTCSDFEFMNRVRPCLQYQIHRCDAPCVKKIDEENYRTIVEQAGLFLKGRKKDLLQKVRQEMEMLSKKEEFEKAAKARDLIAAIEATLEKQAVARHDWLNQDVLHFYREGKEATFCLLQIREGKVWDSRLFHVKGHEEDEEMIENFLTQYYQEEQILPDEILLPSIVTQREPLAEFLSERKGEKVLLLSPQRGDRRDLLRLAYRNAEEGFQQRKNEKASQEEILDELQSALHLQNFPERVECFDISNLSGKQAVGSLVSFANGKADKASYKRFKIKTVSGPNDFSMMKEVLTRRLLHQKEKWEWPNLILIDGGKGQLNVVLEVMKELNVTGIDLAALAKAREGEVADKVYILGRKDSLLLKPHSKILNLLMQIRDEAHRFAITYHKKIREREFLT